MVEFSICCTTYNHVDYISKAIEGFLNQKTNFEYEIIIHDDASQDGTADIIKEYEFNYPGRIRGIYQIENQFSKGLKPFVEIVLPKAKGKYIAWCEGDDYWINDNKLQKQFDFFENHPGFVIHSGHAFVLQGKADGLSIKVHPQLNIPTEYELADFTTSNRLVTSTCAFRNTTLPKLTTTWKKAAAGDWLLWIYLMQTTGLMAYYDNEVYAVYRKHQTGMFGSLNETKTLEFYVKNMPFIVKQFDEKRYRKLSNEKLEWFRTELFRNYLAQKKYFKALALWQKMLWNHSKTNPWKLLFEFRNSVLGTINLIW